MSPTSARCSICSTPTKNPDRRRQHPPLRRGSGESCALAELRLAGGGPQRHDQGRSALGVPDGLLEDRHQPPGWPSPAVDRSSTRPGRSLDQRPGSLDPFPDGGSCIRSAGTVRALRRPRQPRSRRSPGGACDLPRRSGLLHRHGLRPLHRAELDQSPGLKSRPATLRLLRIDGRDDPSRSAGEDAVAAIEIGVAIPQLRLEPRPDPLRIVAGQADQLSGGPIAITTSIAVSMSAPIS